jgi:hypothetical protein
LGKKIAVNTENPYLIALDLVKQHDGSSGQTALAKCILSLYNSNHPFNIREILAPLDRHYTNVVFNMLIALQKNGETAELCQAGNWVYNNFPRLVEMSKTMSEARYELRKKWDAEDEAERKRLYPDED